MYANEQRHRCCVFFEYECVRILCSEFQEMKLKKRNTYGVVPPRYVLTQGSLHYRLPTLGYQKQKAMGFVNLQTSSAPLFLLK